MRTTKHAGARAERHQLTNLTSCEARAESVERPAEAIRASPTIVTRATANCLHIGSLKIGFAN